jgi:uncharacterized Fe-S cluster-containing radical SAM superfamily enzyme
MKFEFETLKFKDGDKIQVDFLKQYYFEIEKEKLLKLSPFKVENGTLIFNNKIKAVIFEQILNDGFKNLKNKISKKKTLYIHQNSGIPLIGSGDFGIVDRGTSLIEIKPLTSCNINCVFCSVDEGISSKKTMDVIIEREYLIQELKKVLLVKKKDIEININPQAEPLLYPEFLELIKDLNSFENVKRITVQTNGVLLTNKLIDDLANAGLTRINFSLNAMDQDVAEKIAGCRYSLKKMKMLIEYAVGRIGIQLAPVWAPGLNDDQIPKLIEYAKKLKIPICIQNFLYYPKGRNPIVEKTFEKFYEELRKLEKQFDIKLIVDAEDFNIEKDETLEKPIRKNEILEVQTFSEGRLPGEVYAVAKERIIKVLTRRTGKFKVKIIRTKHDIYKAVPN